MKDNFDKIYRSSNKYILDVKNDLKIKRRINLIFNIVFNFLIFSINFSILAISTFALFKIFKEYKMHPQIDFNTQVLPTIFAAFFSLLIFVFSIIVTIYAGVNKKNIYKDAYRKIIYENMKYNSIENKLTEVEFKNKIYNIYLGTNKVNIKINVKKIFKKHLLGDKNA